MDLQNLTTKQKVVQWLIIFSAIPVFIILVMILSTLTTGFYMIFNGYGFFESPQNITSGGDLLDILQNLTGTMATVSLVLIYWVAIQKNSFRSIGFMLDKGWLKEIILGLSMGIVLLGLTFVFLLLIGQIHIENIKRAPGTLLKYLVMFLLVGFNEELLTRGYLLGAMRKLVNKYIALVLVAVLFSLMHIFNDNFSFIPFLNIILAGILLGVVYIYTGRLWFAIALHFSWNFIQGPVLGSQVSGNVTKGTVLEITSTGNPLFTGGDFGFEGSLLMTVLMIILILVLGIHYRKRYPDVVSSENDSIQEEGLPA